MNKDGNVMLELLRNRRNPAKSNLDRAGLWEGRWAWARRENWSISERGQSFLTSGSRTNSLAGFLRRGLALETGEMNGTHGSQKQKKVFGGSVLRFKDTETSFCLRQLFDLH